MRYLICYDIKDDKRRKKVADLLEEVAFRIQESVFVGEFAAQDLKKAKAGIKRLVHVNGEQGDIDSVHI